MLNKVCTMAKFKPLLLLLVFLLAFTSLQAQNTNQDVVYLKNGGIYRGTVIEMKVGEFVRLEIIGRNVIVIQMDEIDRITKEPIEGGTNTTTTPTTTSKPQVPVQPIEPEPEPEPVTLERPTEGYVAFVEGTLNIGNSGTFNGPVTYGNVLVSMHVINSYLFNDRFTIGLGTGLEGFGNLTIPGFIDSRYFFFKDDTSPYLFGQAGYALTSGNNSELSHHGGAMLGVGFGIKRYFDKSGVGLMFSTGYRFQALRYTYEPDFSPFGGSTNIQQEINRVTFKFSFMI